MANGGIIGKVNNPTSTTATGVWQQEEQYEAVRDGTWPSRPLFTTKSARFNTASSDYLNRTATSGNRQVSTFSGWIKKSSNGVDTNRVFLEYNSGTNYFEIRFRDTNDDIRIYEELNGSTGFQLITNRSFRDPSAWYHIVVAIDTTQGTASNRIKLYINGVQETSFATETYPAQNYNVQMNVADKAVQIGAYSFSGSNYFNGYMSEIIWVDGTALAPTSFGSTNSDGVWIPAIYTGTYGTNGFNLQFKNAAALGTDSSSNGNTFTVNNLTSIDQSTDYPEVNFATLNSLYKQASSYTIADGNLTANNTSNTWRGLAGTIGVSSGKWYWEAKAVSGVGASNFISFGIGDAEQIPNGDAEPTASSRIYSYKHNGDKANNNSQSSYGATWTNGDIISILYDADNGSLTFYKNGASQGVAFNGLDTSKTWLPITENYGSSAKMSMNFGSAPYAISSGNADANGYGNFEYAVPSGYYSLNTKNLGEFG